MVKLRVNDKSRNNNSVDHLRGLDPELPDGLWHVITGYQPHLPADQWHTVREFVITAVLQMRPRTFDNARRLMSMTARYSCWVWVTTGRTLTTERVFTDRLIQRYRQTALKNTSIAFRHDVVRQLGTMTEKFTGLRTGRLPAPPAHRLAPYTPAEIAAMHSWANTLTTPLKRQNAKALLGLSGGAGLSAAEVMAVRVSDVEAINGRVFVTVPGPKPRRIPVLNAWNRTLMQSVGERTQGDLFHGYRFAEYLPRSLQTFLTEHPCTPRPSASRLACGWLVTLLDAQLPLPLIMELTGYANTSALDPVLKHCAKPRLDDFVGRIIGEEVL